MKEVIERWERTGKLKSITYYLKDGEPFDKLIYDENGEYVNHVMLYDFGFDKQ